MWFFQQLHLSYWKEWQEQLNFQDKQIIIDEFIRNGNRYILDQLCEEGSKDLRGININVSREEFIRKLIGSGVDIEKVKRLVR